LTAAAERDLERLEAFLAAKNERAALAATDALIAVTIACDCGDSALNFSSPPPLPNGI
jgi:plasmid stabilization system protein ParE